MGPGFESLKVHQEKRDAFLHLFFLATFVRGELLVRPIAKQWHEERSDEVVPETLLLHLFFLATFVGGELLVRPIAKQWHEERSDEVVPESAHTPQGVYFVPVLSVRPAEGAAKNKASACPFKRTGPLSLRIFIHYADPVRKWKRWGRDACRPYLPASASVL